MKTGIFTTLNKKGQIVIPKEIRESLGINQDVTLNIKVVGKGIHIYPVDTFITKSENESSYLHLLEKTKGKWKDDLEDEIAKDKKTQIELQASDKRKMHSNF